MLRFGKFGYRYEWLMLTNIFKSTVVICALLGSSFVGAASASKEDQLADLIERVQSQKGEEKVAQLENQMLGRASWEISCWIKVFDDTKICTMQRGDIIVMRLNNIYSVSIGENHTKNTFTSVRVDDNKTEEAREGLFRNASSLIQQLKQGKNVYTRYKQGSSGKELDAKVSLVGFTAAYTDMQNQFERLGKR